MAEADIRPMETGMRRPVWRDGKSHVLFEPIECLEKLGARKAVIRPHAPPPTTATSTS